MNYEKLKTELTNIVLDSIFTSHGLNINDIWKIRDNTIEFGIGNYTKIIKAMIQWPYQDFNSVRYIQCTAKKMLIDELIPLMPDRSAVLICGSWHGILALMLKHQGYGEDCTCIDTDLEACKVARYLGVPTHFYNMFEMEMDKYNVIINTGCEHIILKKWAAGIPQGKLVALQATNMPYRTHINPIESIGQFEKEVPNISPISTNQQSFTGQEPERKIYTRFQFIGVT